MIFALTDTMSSTIVGVGLAAMLAVIGWALRYILNDLRARVGTPNGHGDVVSMLETVIKRLGRGDERMDRIERRVEEVQDELVRVSREHGARLGGLESEVSALKGAPCLHEGSNV